MQVWLWKDKPWVDGQAHTLPPRPTAAPRACHAVWEAEIINTVSQRISYWHLVKLQGERSPEVAAGKGATKEPCWPCQAQSHGGGAQWPCVGAQTTEKKMLAWAGTPEAMRWVWFWQASMKLSSASNATSKEKRDCYGNTDRDTK